MLKLPLVSFVVTSYNYADFIEMTLESIKSQTYKNFEIIVVDDCSTDNSKEIIEKFIEFNQDLRITFLKHEENKGQLASMLDGLKIAQGAFVSFIDSDDVLLKEYAETHIKIHMQTSIAFTSSEIAEIDENNQIHTIKSLFAPHKSDNIEVLSLDNILKIDPEKVEYKIVKNKHFGKWYWAPNSSAMFRKSAIDILLNYKNTDKWRVCPDKFIFNFAHLVGGSANVYAPLIGYRRHKKNAGNGGYICGNNKYPDDKISKTYLCNNIKIKPETFWFIFNNKKIFREKFGSRGFIKLILGTLI